MFSFVKEFNARRASVPILLIFLGIALVFFFNLLLPGAAPGEKRISIYSRIASYSVPVEDVSGQEYCGLLEALEPLGAVTAKADGKRWKLRYNDVELEFTVSQTRVRIKGGDFELGAPFLIQADRGLVPLSSMGALLSRILGGPVTFNPVSRRLFVGNIAIHFTAQLTAATPPSLVMNFTGPVNPTIATEAGKLHMTFNQEPVVAPGTQKLTFDNKTIGSAFYEEGNGAAEITVTGSVPLFAAFSNNRKTITIAPPASITAQSQPAPAPATPSTPSPSPSTANSTSQALFVVVDPSHGGDDRGAALNGEVAEKDLTLAIALRLRGELYARGLQTLLLRSEDVSLSLDQRAGITNGAHPELYICLHVASQGSGVRVYTALLPVGQQSRGAFLDWDGAQASSMVASQEAAAVFVNSLQDSKIPARELTAPLRPLNNLAVPAIAVEIAPPPANAMALYSADYQQLVATSIATALDAVQQKTQGKIPQNKQ